MTTITGIAALRARLDTERAAGRTVGFVPTMGYLHAGHASLMTRARTETDVVIVSIFVNPLQFAAGEDLAAYPRDLSADRALAQAEGVDVLFVPTEAEMYPDGVVRTSVRVAQVSAGLEASTRPTHFDGVATVLAKLFAIVGTCRAYFGEKDFQQIAVVRRMVRDLSVPVEVVACPTQRDPDGLALSSRNSYLLDAERAVAPVLHAALLAGRMAIDAGEVNPAKVRALMADLISAEPLAHLDYAEVVDAATLQTVDPLVGELRLLAAARFGKARLIDNIGAEV
ncbi:MAG: pantoate--beta-alanine ligase [Acidimicrobiia bacterium]|nr:pantoate--beta-alanine ligase [Acidimicrobiia bacterium]